MNFTNKGLADSAQTVSKLIEFRQELEAKTNGKAAEGVDLSHPVVNEFASALADDLNIAAALGVMHPWVKGDHPDPHESLAVWKLMNSVLSIAPINEGAVGAEGVADSGDDPTLEQAEKWCKEMDKARSVKDFATSDALRKKIEDLGFEVQQTKEGAVIKKQLA